MHKKFELNQTKIKGAIRKIIKQQTKKAGPRRLALAQPQKRACTFIHNLRLILCRFLDGFYLPFLDKVSSLFTFFKRQTYRQCRRL